MQVHVREWGRWLAACVQQWRVPNGVGGGHPVRGPDGEFGCGGTMRRVTGVIGMPFIGARERP